MHNINYQQLIQHVMCEQVHIKEQGSIPTYISELSNVDPNKLGIHLVTTDKSHYSAGDSNEKFSIQSISKVLSLVLAYKEAGENIWERVGVEPSSSAFNSLDLLEQTKGIPRNPLINAGAIVICDMLISLFDDPKFELINFIRSISENKTIDYCPQIAISEKQTAYRNVALINLMKDFKNINNDPEAVLDLYFHLCSIKMSCKELAESFLFLASNGITPFSGKKIINQSQTKRINSIMQLCGFYDEAGQFSFRVGLPGKSGVGGGIVAVLPGRFSIAVWSPKLNTKGNPIKGMNILESITTKSQLSIF